MTSRNASQPRARNSTSSRAPAGKVLAELAGPVAAVITGPGARTIQIGPPGDPVARITSDAGAFLRWVTQRATPEEAGAEMSGDAGQLALARSLRIF